MPANRKPSPKAITLRIARLRRFAHPRPGPGDEPPADLKITNLKITLPADRQRTPPNRTSPHHQQQASPPCWPG